jgi:hypothetical protein
VHCLWHVQTYVPMTPVWDQHMQPQPAGHSPPSRVHVVEPGPSAEAPSAGEVASVPDEVASVPGVVESVPASATGQAYVGQAVATQNCAPEQSKHDVGAEAGHTPPPSTPGAPASPGDAS